MRMMVPALTTALWLAVAGCTSQVVVPAAGDGDKGAAVPAAPAPAPAGFRFPDIPPVLIPDVTTMTTAAATYASELDDLLTPVSGLEVTGARCDGDGVVVNRAGLTQVDDGRGGRSVVGEDASVTVGGDGSGTVVDANRSITVAGDGSGTYVDGAVSLTIEKDGSGTYVDAEKSITVNADGSGTYVDPDTSVTVNPDGSGTFVDATRSITVGPGSGSYVDATVSVTNNGDGTGLVNGVEQAMPPVDPMPLLGRFPPVRALEPVGTACGTLIRISDRVLFDFDRSELRPEADAVLDRLGTALAGAGGPIQVGGHTDAKGGDAYNAELSQRRADTVRSALATRKVPADIEATGYGETRPIAPNEVDGHDDPAGRQLNRRVEILLPG